MVLLLGVAALDELLAGLPVLASPDVRAEFALGYAGIAAVLLVVPEFVGAMLEIPLFLWADRCRRKPFIVSGLAAMGLCTIGAGLAPSSVWLALALIGWYVGSGCGVSLAQVALVEAEPDRSELLMTRWTLASSIGDLTAPLLLPVLSLLALGWRAGFVMAGMLVLVYALVLARIDFNEAKKREDHTASDDSVGVSKSDGHSPSSTPTLRGALATGLANPALLAWQLGCWLCGLLDEVLVVFASLHLRQNLGADLAAQALVILSFSIGSVLGLVISDRLLGRYSGLRLARLSAAGCLVSYLAWLGAGSMFASGAWLFVVGIFCAPLYPVAKAQAYRALPGQPGVVNAVGNLFAPASLALPLVIGLVAEWHGLVWALTCLALQPLGLWFIAGHFARSGPGDEKDIRPKRVS